MNQLDDIEARATRIAAFKMTSAEKDRALLLDLVREQAAKLNAIAKVTEAFDSDTRCMEDVEQTGLLADQAISDIQALLGGWS